MERMATHQEGVSQQQVWDSVLLVLSACLSREEEEAMALLQLLSCRLAGDRRRELSLSLSPSRNRSDKSDDEQLSLVAVREREGKSNNLTQERLSLLHHLTQLRLCYLCWDSHSRSLAVAALASCVHRLLQLVSHLLQPLPLSLSGSLLLPLVIR